MKQRVLDERKQELENLDVLFSSLKTKISDESRALVGLYSKQKEVKKVLSGLITEVAHKNSDLRKLQVAILGAEEDRQNILGDTTSTKEKFRIEKEEYYQELEEITKKLAEEKETLKYTSSLFSRTLNEFKSRSTLLSTNVKKLEELRSKKSEELDTLNVQIDQRKKQFESEEERYTETINKLEKKIKPLENKLSEKVVKYNRIKDSFLRESQEIKRKRKDLATLARRIEKYYQKRDPSFKINI